MHVLSIFGVFFCNACRSEEVIECTAPVLSDTACKSRYVVAVLCEQCSVCNYFHGNYYD